MILSGCGTPETHTGVEAGVFAPPNGRKIAVKIRTLTALTLAALAAAATFSAVNTPAARVQTVAQPTSRLCVDYAAGALTVQVQGDSVAAGYGVSVAERWTSQLDDKLPGSSVVWNAAVSGTRAEDYAPGGPYNFHVQFAATVKPSLVIMNWRINDQWWGNAHPTVYTPETFKARYREIIGAIRTASPTTTFAIAVSPWVLDTRLDDGAYNQWDYIVALWQLKDELDLVWLDLGRFFPSAGQSNSAGLLQGDLTHPSTAGQSVMAATAFEFLRSYCGKVQA